MCGNIDEETIFSAQIGLHEGADQQNIQQLAGVRENAERVCLWCSSYSMWYALQTDFPHSLDLLRQHV